MYTYARDPEAPAQEDGLACLPSDMTTFGMLFREGRLLLRDYSSQPIPLFDAADSGS